MGWESAEKICQLLKIRSPIQLKAVEILSELAGYSKRADLLTSQMKTVLRKQGIGPARIDQNLRQLQQLGFIQIRKAQEGPRFALDKNIWDAKANNIDVIFRIARLEGKNRRSDTKAKKIIKEVKAKVEGSGNLSTHLPQKFYVAVVNLALLSLTDWEFKDGEVVQKKFTKQPKLPLGKSKMPRATRSRTVTEKPENESPVKPLDEAEFADMPKGVEFENCDIKEVLDGALDHLESEGAKLLFNGFLATIDIPLARSRRQRVSLIYRRDHLHSPILWFYTQCGEIGQQKSQYLEAFEANNSCFPHKVTLLDIDGKKHLGCCSSIPMDAAGRWKSKTGETIRRLANFGDQLEEMYWGQDKN